MSELTVNTAPELNGVEASKAEQIKATFEGMYNLLKTFEGSYASLIEEANKGINKELTAKAKRLRLDIAKVRIEAEKARKQQKEQYLRAGKAIDGVANILKYAVQDKEEKLKSIEKHFEILEAKRLEALKSERLNLISKYVENPEELDLLKFTNDEFSSFLAAKKNEHEEKLAEEARLAAEARAKAEAEALERKRIKEENERLKAEAEVLRKAQEAERLKAEKQQAELKAKHDAKLKAAAEARAKAEAELKAKHDAEEAAKLEKYKKEQAFLTASDHEKAEALINDLQALKRKYRFESDLYANKYVKISESLSSLIHFMKS